MNKPPQFSGRLGDLPAELLELNRWLSDLYYQLVSRLEYKPITTRIAANYTVLITDTAVAVTSTAAPRTITIPSKIIALKDWKIEISDESGGAAANNITIATQGSEKINGADTYKITNNYGSATIRSNGSNLFIR